LSGALKDYLDSHNKGTIMSFVACTHPNVVDHYMKQGDSAFQDKFSLMSADEGGDYLQDATIKSIEFSGKEIHVHYQLLSAVDPFFEMDAREVTLIAMSYNDGNSWYFAEKKDYLNNDIFSKEDRLLELK